MVREIIDAIQEEYVVHIPREYMNRKVEILILPFDSSADFSVTSKRQSIIGDTAGILKGRVGDPVVSEKD